MNYFRPASFLRPVRFQLLLALIALSANSQVFLNGSFENNTAGAWANGVLNNLHNDPFNALVPNCHSYGELVQGIDGHLDLMHAFVSQWSNVEPAQDGDWYIGLGEDPRDRLSLELSEPLVPGADYTIAYFEKGVSNSMPIRFGLSAVNDQNGTVIYTTPTPAPLDEWTERTFTFTAPDNGRFITLCQAVGTQAWVMIDHFTLTLNPCEVSADLGEDLTICEGESAVLDAGTVPGAAYEWSDGSTAQFLEVNHAGIWTVTVIKPGCTASDAIAVVVETAPVPVFAADTEHGCAPLDVHFFSELLPGQTASWNFGDGSAPGQNGWAHTYTGDGCFDVSLTVTSANGCTATATIADRICVDPKPTAAFYFSPNTIWSDDPAVKFHNTSSLNAVNAWSFGSGTSPEAEPLVVFPETAANYHIQLVVFSEQGCSDTARRLLAIEYQYNLYVPNAFTPDGNEFNNVFEPVIGIGYDTTDYTLEIFDRWGEVLFESADVQVGWDGSYAGQLAKNGIYSWRLTIGDAHSDARIVQTGSVALIR